MSWKEKYKEHLTPSGQLKRTSSTELKTEVFIARAREVHGDRYDYSKTVYTSADDKISIVCEIHGEFSQRAIDHLKGRGCSTCGKSIGPAPDTVKEFVFKAKRFHGDAYDYSKVVYTNSKTHVEIICPEHGSFTQRPNDHVNGHGCPKCAVSNQNIIYLIEYLSAGELLGTKVGITNNFDKRFAKLKLASPYDMEFVQYWIVDNPRTIESAVLNRFTRVGNLGAYFEGSTEILEGPTEQIAQFIEGLVYASI